MKTVKGKVDGKQFGRDSTVIMVQFKSINDTQPKVHQMSH